MEGVRCRVSCETIELYDQWDTSWGKRDGDGKWLGGGCRRKKTSDHRKEGKMLPKLPRGKIMDSKPTRLEEGQCKKAVM